jgi:hypothetical protein
MLLALGLPPLLGGAPPMLEVMRTSVRTRA